MDARLENRRNDSTAKCANCAFWSKRDSVLAVWGDCTLADDTSTTDLTVCSAWRLHEVHTGKILPPEEIIDDR